MTHDVLVVGAGPAGSVTAKRLAAAGVRVALVGAASRPGWEGLSARSCALLIEEDLEGSVLAAAAGVCGPVPRRGVWAEGRAVEGSEWLVDRRRLAAALRAAAARAGADYRPDSVTHSARNGGLWRLRLRAGGTLAAPLLIDARGRRGAELRGPLLLAHARQFALQRDDGSGTQIQVADFGWCWWAARERRLWVQLIARPRTGQAAAHPDGWLAAAAAQIPLLARLLVEAAPAGAAVARPAHARRGRPATDATCWQVGDAAVALDPLSGQGVYEALRGARLVATAVQSVLNGGEAALAQRFVTERHDAAWAKGVRMAAGFYGENARRSGFWAMTAAAYERLLPEPPPAAPYIARRPVLVEGRILEQEVIVTAENPRGVWHVAGVPLARLKGYLEAAAPATVDGAAAALDRPRGAVASAIHWLQETGIMRGQIGHRVMPGG